MNVRCNRSRRLLALASALALTAALAPAAFAQVTEPEDDAPESRGIDRVCPAPGDDGFPITEPEQQFEDSQGTHADAIECLGTYLIAEGYEDGTFRPGEAINRAQMATFVANWIETATGQELAFDADAEYFPDIAGTHEDAIKQLAEAGVVSGLADGSYGPGATVSRGQMARFIANAIDYADTYEVDSSLPPADDTVYFDDVTDSAFQADVQRIAGVGIVEGDSEGNYGVGRPVTRGQMASFLMRGADYGDRQQRWLPTAVIAEFIVPLSGLSVIGENGEPGQGELGASGEATITVNAFDNLLEYEIDFSEYSGPYSSSGGVAIHLGDVGENGDAVVPLATGAELEDAEDGIVTGTVSQLDAPAYRFAELVENPSDHYVLLTSDGYPEGAARGQLPAGSEDDDEEEPIDGEEPPGDEIPIPGPPEQ